MRDRLNIAVPETLKVALWVFVSAGLTAFFSWALQRPELVDYYGILNIGLYFLNELKKKA